MDTHRHTLQHVVHLGAILGKIISLRGRMSLRLLTGVTRKMANIRRKVRKATFPLNLTGIGELTNDGNRKKNTCT